MCVLLDTDLVSKGFQVLQLYNVANSEDAQQQQKIMQALYK